MHMKQDSNSGSSPRMRGALVDDLEGAAVERIIPADAGSTSYIEMTLQNGRDHPRGCGEHRDGTRQRSYRTGSSPRMRGAHSA